MVINYDLPNVSETYVHRIGRTGRASASGIALSFCDKEERPYLRDIEKLIKQAVPRMPEHQFVDDDSETEEDVQPKHQKPNKTSHPNQNKNRNRNRNRNKNRNSSGTSKFRGSKPKGQRNSDSQ